MKQYCRYCCYLIVGDANYCSMRDKTISEATGKGQGNMTNAEKIKQMDIVELAEVIMCPYGIEEGMCNNDAGCLSCCREWLESEAD